MRSRAALVHAPPDPNHRRLDPPVRFWLRQRAFARSDSAARGGAGVTRRTEAGRRPCRSSDPLVHHLQVVLAVVRSPLHQSARWPPPTRRACKCSVSSGKQVEARLVHVPSARRRLGGVGRRGRAGELLAPPGSHARPRRAGMRRERVDVPRNAAAPRGEVLIRCSTFTLNLPKRRAALTLTGPNTPNAIFP